MWCTQLQSVELQQGYRHVHTSWGPRVAHCMLLSSFTPPHTLPSWSAPQALPAVHHSLHGGDVALRGAVHGWAGRAWIGMGDGVQRDAGIGGTEMWQPASSRFPIKSLRMAWLMAAPRPVAPCNLAFTLAPPPPPSAPHFAIPLFRHLFV